MKIFLKNEGRGVAVVDAFLKHAPLFIVSSEGGAALAEGPQSFQIAYAMLVKRGRKFFIRVLRPEVFFPEKGFDEGRRAHRFALGNTHFCVGVVEKGRGASPAIKKPLFACLLIFSAVAVAVAVLGLIEKKGKALVKETPKRARFMTGGETAAMEDAAARLRAGDTAQARLTLMQAKGEKAAGLLRRIEDEGVRPEEAEDASARRVAGAQKHFDSALALVQKGAHRDAKRELDKAFAELKGLKAAPPFISEMKKLKGNVVSKLEDEMAVIAFEVEELSRGVENALPRDGVAAIREVKARLDELRALLPDSNEGANMQRTVGTAISAVAQRWQAKAESAERLFGCERAAPIYEEMAFAFKGADETRSREAKSRAELCVGGGS